MWLCRLRFLDGGVLLFLLALRLAVLCRLALSLVQRRFDQPEDELPLGEPLAGAGALAALEDANIWDARRILIDAEQRAEENYVTSTD